MTTTTTENWITVCHELDLVKNSGVCALVNEQQVALFKLTSANDGQIYAISNWDPIGKANVLYRGLLGSIKDKPVVASPLYKQRYCLSTGQCMDDLAQKVQVYPCRIVEQQVQLHFATAS
jgi:nitrite reductase (NADH) small subunit